MRLRVRLVVTTVLLAFIGFGAFGTLGASAGQAPPIFPHRHLLVTPQGLIPVGPAVCENPSLQSAFNQFHAKIHVGPANTAFDHSHNPVDITAAAC
ncbi:MAG: hypothetical protein ACRDV2_09310 [Actinomycetes bacterium]